MCFAMIITRIIIWVTSITRQAYYRTIRLYQCHLHLISYTKRYSLYTMNGYLLSFTQGRWNYERWGGFDSNIEPQCKASRAATFTWRLLKDRLPTKGNLLRRNIIIQDADCPLCGQVQEEVQKYHIKTMELSFNKVDGTMIDGVGASWKNLSHSLSGLFCASINFVESSTTYSAPELAFQSALGSLRYGTLPREARLHLTMSTDHSDGSRSGINLEQTVTVVLQPNDQKAGMNHKSTAKFAVNDTGPEDFRRNAGFELSVTPKRVHAEMETSSSILYEYPIKEYTETEQFDLGLTWKHPIVWYSPHAPLYASRFSMGSGNERGAIAISLKLIQGLVAINNVKERCIYYHTLQLVVDERPQALTDFVERMRVSPSEDKVSPGVMEMGFLHIDEYPPDVNQGFGIPSAIISFPDFHAELLLVPLTTPDFGMPYNVITITCTVFALYFESLLNVLWRGVGEEERLLKNKGIAVAWQYYS
uniref:Reverse transcriptase zinc-binding domain-containing protein n=1 Tax=Glycine max TaxID=3847 RepID=A0A0R0HBS2_SOYBN